MNGVNEVLLKTITDTITEQEPSMENARLLAYECYRGLVEHYPQVNPQTRISILDRHYSLQVNTVNYDPSAHAVYWTAPLQVKVERPGLKAKLSRIAGDLLNNKELADKGYRAGKYQPPAVRTTQVFERTLEIKRWGMDVYPYGQITAACAYDQLGDTLWIRVKWYPERNRPLWASEL